MHIDPNRNILILEEEWAGVEENQKGEDEYKPTASTTTWEGFPHPALPPHPAPLLPTTLRFLGLFNTSSSTLIISEFHCIGKRKLITQQNR